MGDFVKKHGLLYSSDLHTVIGVDDTSTEFTGRIPYGAHAVDDEVFTDCPYESISIPDSVKRLGNCLFENSKALEKVKLPSSITELPPYRFSGCSALSKVTMPNELSELSEGLFKDCVSLTEIPFRAGITVLPENVMSGCTAVTSLIIPNTVTSIGPSAVAGCTGLKTVVFPSTIQSVAANAFEGCSSLNNIRIDGESDIFYVSEKDGCLYMRTEDGYNLVVKSVGVQNSGVSFYKDNVDDEPIEESEDEEQEEDDTFYTTEIGAMDEELEKFDDIKTEKVEVKKMDNSNIDSMLADIMGAEKERSSVTEDIGVSESESAVLSETMEVMSESNQASSKGAVSNDELAMLFEKHEEQVESEKVSGFERSLELDSKAQILMDSVSFSKLLEFEPSGEVAEDPDLFVIAEKTVTDADGNTNFSAKLLSCCKTFARIHDFRRVILLNGLPLDNDEFMQFYHHYIARKNVILACEAASPSLLSDYCKTVCAESRISLNNDELNQQRKRITVKKNTLIKFVIKDKYED